MRTIYINIYNAAGRRVRLWHGDETPPAALTKENDMWLDTTAKRFKIYDGATWVTWT